MPIGNPSSNYIKNDIVVNHHPTNNNYGEEEIRHITRKRDVRILPLVCLFYLCSFLDRVNIGNAKLAGLLEDTKMTESEFNNALSIFFVGYIIFEVPANMMLNKIGPRIWMAILMGVWGVIMCSMAAVKNGTQLIVARLFLGVAEAGLIPAIIFYLSRWYTKNEQARRIAIFYGCSTCAGAFGGVLAYGLMKLDGRQGLSGWQWIFIIESIPTLVMSIVCLVALPDFPETSSFLKEHEKKVLLELLSKDNGSDLENKEIEFSKKQFFAVFRDWKTYSFSILTFCLVTGIYSVSMFLPTIIHGMGFDALIAQAMSSPPWVVACFFTILTGISADKQSERGLHVAIPSFIAGVGFILLIVLKHTVGLYISTMIVTSGIYSACGINMPWITNNFLGSTKRSVAIATVNSFGNIGGIVAGQLYRANDGPYYIHGHAACVGVMLGVSLIAFSIKFSFIYINKKRRNMTIEERQVVIKNNEELCDKVSIICIYDEA
ncbi:major facilitator superfamily domain-containing protein [Phascolomyces articulosus]|uniref:Major facilitator superfamily domain-containing protein n=1 Tax=Phascolomyces articulosus TaxID=60185 RepID=A0AAD5K784_9FUNG|nr:major facilitator superfamily domain-containing protein [Phascolomyces articulosus]